MRCMMEIFLDFTRRTGHPHPHLDAALTNYKAILMDLGRREAEVEADIRALQGTTRGTGVEPKFILVVVDAVQQGAQGNEARRRLRNP